MKNFEAQSMMGAKKEDKEVSDEILRDAELAHAQILAKRRKDVEQAKAQSDQELFSFEKLRTLMNFSRDFDDGEMELTPEFVEDLEAEYYLRYPNANTLEEFAQRKRDLAASSGE